MAFFGKLKSIFAGGGGGDNKKKSKNSNFIKRDQDPNLLWEIVGELGDGAFGKVYKVRRQQH